MKFLTFGEIVWDAFRAALIHGLAPGRDPQKTLEQAGRVGAFAYTREGRMPTITSLVMESVASATVCQRKSINENQR